MSEGKKEQDSYETLADIVAEMREARTDFPFVYLMGEPDTPEVIDFKSKEIIEPRRINIRRVTVKELADRIEAAWNREHGNAAAMRAALKPWISMGEWLLENAGKDALGAGIAKMSPAIRQRLEEARAALSAPPRNCDVGTAEEQTKRFSDFCAAHRQTDLPRCAECPLENTPPDTGCSFAWAQMPYTEGGANEQG